ncbi:hypothetical protein [Nesterenkonia pannonica]|uniref:hypothetical protein n=1 Tax=Nesterenkonia pannonica TaxID=1548602 RepID=UPI002164CD76|nr:hypothetical protein [Nesterenkonia pannonica]
MFVALFGTALVAPGAHATNDPAPSSGVEVISDIAYTDPVPESTRGNLLDLYLPEDTDGEPTPLVIWSSGSAWMADNGKDGAAAIAEVFNDKGFAVAGVSVRSSFQVNFRVSCTTFAPPSGGCEATLTSTTLIRTEWRSWATHQEAG